VVRCGKADKAFSNPKGAVTVLAPTNEAITAFLKTLGVSAKDALSNEVLCDTLIRYHVLPYKATAANITKPNTKAQTLEPRSFLTFNKGPGGVTVTDVQGNTAKVTKADFVVGDAVIHGVDKVLLSDKVFPSIAAAVEYHKTKHSALIKALKDAGLLGTLTDAKKPFKGTILAPTNDAFAALKATPKDLKSVLLYHVLPEVVVLPQGIDNKKTFATLYTGHSVTFGKTLGTAKDQFGTLRNIAIIDVKSDAGTTAKVVKHNVFAGQAVIQGIDKVLIPNTATAGRKMLEAAAATRQLLQGGGRGGQGADIMDFRQQNSLFDTAGDISAAAGGGSPAAAGAAGVADSSSVGVFDGY